MFSKVSRTRLFFVTDVHGSEICFRKFLNAAGFYRAQVLILGGDITGKSIVPVIRRPDGSYEANHLGNQVEVRSDDGLKKTLKVISDSGAYPYITDRAGFDELQASRAKQDELFTELIVERIREWMTLADERLKGTAVKRFISPGNDDIFQIDPVLSSASEVINPEEKVVEIDGSHEMITLGYTNHTPWHSPREVDESVLLEKVERLASGVKRMKNAIFNLHVPPIDTPIDQAPKVSADLKYVTTVGQVEIISAGSVSVRKAIEEHQPMLGVHGHIHESRGVVTIGRTLCANPGSEYGEGILRGFLADLEGTSINSYLLTSG